MRAKLAFRPGDTFNATLSLDYTRQDTALTLGQPTAPLNATDLVFGPVLLSAPPTRRVRLRDAHFVLAGQGPGADATRARR